MPELPEVEAVRRDLARWLRDERIVRVELRRANLRRAFPSDLVSRLRGRRVGSVARRGKNLLVYLDSGDTLLVHLGMSGSFRATGVGEADPDADKHDHVALELSSGRTVTFNDPRRFGVMDLMRADDAGARDAMAALGPEPLDQTFDATALAKACAGKRAALKVALLDQRLVAGVGNIYASEALHHARLSPRRRAASIATPSGAPRDTAVRLVAGIKAVLQRAIDRQEQAYRSGRFRVYEREDQPCLRRGCHGTIRRITQAGRSSYFCPVCQR